MISGERTEMPVVTDAVRWELIQFAQRDHMSFAGMLASIIGIWLVGIFGDITDFVVAWAEHSAMSVLLELLFMTALSGVVLWRWLRQKGRSPLEDLRAGRYSVVRFTVSGKEEKSSGDRRYLLRDEHGDVYCCTSLLTFREAQIGRTAYGVRCVNGAGFVPKNFNIMY